MTKGHIPDYRSAIERAKVSAKNIVVDVPALNRSHYDWAFQDTDNTELIKFREKFHLDKIIEGATSEWHAFLLIRNWVYMQNSRGGGNGPGGVPAADTEAIVLACNAGASFFCTYFARLMRAVTLALGYGSRLVSVGTDFDRWNKNTGHGVCEVWSNEFKKWIVIDAHYDTHFEIRGVPLNTYEVHRAAVEGRQEEVDYGKGPDGQLVDPYENGRKWPEGGSQLDTYFWKNYHLKNTPFQTNGSWDFTKYILLEDESHKNKTWNQGPNKKHIAYKNKFVPETNLGEVYFDLNCIYLEPKVLDEEGANRGIAAFDVGTFTPNLSHLEIQLDNKTWQPQSVWTRVQWPLHKGDNTFAVRAVNKMGHKGPVSRLIANGVEYVYPNANNKTVNADLVAARS